MQTVKHSNHKAHKFFYLIFHIIFIQKRLIYQGGLKMAVDWNYLNEEQKEAIRETEGYVRIIAGAGSGKTKVLVNRFVYLVIECGVDPASILCVTFTKKAANEMKKRIRALLGDEFETNLISTYHGFCNRILREEAEKLHLDKGFQILTTSQQKGILNDIYDKLNFEKENLSLDKMLKKIADYKKDGNYVSKICNSEPTQIKDVIFTEIDWIIETYLQKQKATYSVDYNDLIHFAIYILENYEEVRIKWQERLNYIMVDEFQDSSKIEMRLLELISGKYHNLMVVGDPDQNIYEWRGSDVRLLVEFDKFHKNTKTIILNQNYRSTPQILKCANFLIEKNKIRIKKELYTKNQDGPEVTYIHSKNDYEQMDTILDFIKNLNLQEKVGLSNIAIIFRASYLSGIVEKKLLEKNIPYEIFGDINFYERKEIQDIIAYLRLIAYDDDLSLKRVINVPSRRFGKVKMNKLEEMQDTGISLYETLKQNIGIKEFQQSGVNEFVNLIEDIRSNSETMSIADIINKVSSESGYESYIRNSGDEDSLDNLAEFKRLSNEFENEFGERLTLNDFLQQLALQFLDQRENTETIKLMTIHASKGLEFETVFVIGMTEGIFPSSKTIEEKKELGLEEERRLCYVAITRAKKNLFLCDSEGITRDGKFKFTSRFIDEIGRANFKTIGNIPEEANNERHLNRASNTGIFYIEKNIGDIVNHPIFGRGIVVAVDNRYGNYIIKFDKIDQTRSISKTFFK